MDEQRATIGGIHPRRLAGVVGLVVLVVLVILAVVFYRQIGSLLRPALRQPAAQIAETQDVRVQRGHITKVLRLMGTIQPSREAKLAFQVAQGEVIAVAVNTGQTVQAGQTLVELDVAVLERELAKLRAELLEARGELLDLIDESNLMKRIQLQEELRQANAALDQARHELQAYVAGKGTPQEKRAQAAADLANAKVDLAVLRDSEDWQRQIQQLQVTYNLAENKHGPYVLIEKPSEKDMDTELLLRNDMLDKHEALDQAKLQYEMDIRAAEQRVAVAEQTLQALDREIAAGSPTIEHMRRKAAVQQATAKVQQILAQLAALDEATLDVDVAQAQANVLKLEGKVADAETAVAEATLVAPFDGVVDEVKVAPGATVSPGTELLTMFSASSFYVLARVNEIEIAQLTAGQEAQLTVDALRGQMLAGQLGEIPSFGTYQNGLTVFDVKVTFAAGELPLWVGMSANVNVPLFRKEDVLIIPAMAVQRDVEGAFVIVVQGRRTERRRVQLGITDGINIEVVEGLEKGEVVRVALQGPIQPR
jgi:HlyD family secretion protein